MQKIYNVFVSKPCTLKIQTSKYITKKNHQKNPQKHEFVNISNGYQINTYTCTKLNTKLNTY